MDMTSHKRAPGQDWLDQVFKSRAVETGGVIRRQIADVEREVGRAALISEVRRRNFRLIRTRAHFVIVCDPGPVQQIV